MLEIFIYILCLAVAVCVLSVVVQLGAIAYVVVSDFRKSPKDMRSARIDFHLRHPRAHAVIVKSKLIGGVGWKVAAGLGIFVVGLVIFRGK